MKWRSADHGHEHILEVSEDASKHPSFLKRCKQYCTAADIRTMGVVYIESRLQYSLHVQAEVLKY